MNTEHNEQVAFVEWLRLKNIQHTAIPNGLYSKNWSQLKKLQREGLNSGLPDLFLIVPHYDGENRGVFIEMKRKNLKPKRGGKGGLSVQQQRWINDINSCKEMQAFVAYGADDAIEIIEKLIDENK